MLYTILSSLKTEPVVSSQTKCAKSSCTKKAEVFLSCDLVRRAYEPASWVLFLTYLKNTLGLLLLLLCSSCGKLSELQNIYLRYDICEAVDVRFQSLNNIATNLRVEVVKPLERASNANYYLAGEVHYYDQDNQLLAIVIYGLGPQETWATKEVFEIANPSITTSISSSTSSGSSICRFEQITQAAAL